MDQINLASKCIKEGELVIFPTETVYGIGADAMNPIAVKKIYKAKNRPSQNPIIVHISNRLQIDGIVEKVGTIENKLIDKFWPGPLTIIFQRHKNMPDAVSAGKDTIAVRMPSNDIVRDLIKEAGTPIAAPSANISGRVSPTDFTDLDPEITQQVCAVIDGGKCMYGLESTVVRVMDRKVYILRHGAVTKEMIEHIGLEVAEREDKEILSPGTSFKHYSPKSKIIMVEKSLYKDQIENYVNKGVVVAAIGVDQLLLGLDESVKKISLGDENDLEQVAGNVFSALMELDKVDVQLGIVHDFTNEGIGAAIMDRLKRASVSI